MDIPVLVTEHITAGKRLIEALDNEGLQILTAFWFYREESELYELRLASPLYDEKGPTYLLTEIQTVIANMTPKSKLDLQNTAVISPDKSMVKALNRKLRIDDLDEGVRYTKTVFDGVYFDDIYVYRTAALELQTVPG